MVLALFLCPLAADDRSVAADQVFANLHAQFAPGCAAGVIHDGHFIYTSTFGFADLEQTTPVTASTAFQVASLSKQFTAAAVFLLKQDGKLKLEDSVRRFVPELPAYADTIRIADLLHHTSGLRDIAPLLEAGAAGRAPEPLDVGASLKLLASQSALNFSPGTDYEYTNSDYLLLGLIVERAGGMPLAEFAQQRMFAPLGMRGSAFHARIDQLTNRAAGYFARGGQFRRVPVTWLAGGDGGLYTTLEDLLRWDQAFYSAQPFGEEFADFMESRGRLASGERIDYASGLIIGRFRGLRTVSHTGRVPGTRSAMLRFPGQQLSVVCLCNRSDADPPALARELAAIYLGGKLHSPPAPADLDYLTSGFPELAGIWESKQGWVARVWSSSGSLFVETAEGHYHMEPLNRRQLFDFSGTSGLTLTRISSDQFVLQFDGGLRTVYTRLQATPPLRSELGALAGEYRSSDVDVRYRVAMQDGKLQLIAASGWHLALNPVGADRFLLGPWTLRFTRAPDGSVTALEWHQARVWNLVFEKVAAATAALDH